MKKQCSNCFYYDKCRSAEICRDYIPLYEEREDMDIEDMIEDGRQSFYEEWAKYIEKFNS